MTIPMADRGACPCCCEGMRALIRVFTVYGKLSCISGTRDPDVTVVGRLLDPCYDSSCNWQLVNPMSTRRWYPTLCVVISSFAS